MTCLFILSFIPEPHGYADNANANALVDLMNFSTVPNLIIRFTMSANEARVNNIEVILI